MQMEAQPTFAQLYLHIDKIGPGGITMSRDGVPTLDQPTNEKGQAPNQRNLYVSYKSFPTLEKLVTSVQHGKNEP